MKLLNVAYKATIEILSLQQQINFTISVAYLRIGVFHSFTNWFMTTAATDIML